jgi:hypothetical protein
MQQLVETDLMQIQTMFDEVITPLLIAFGTVALTIPLPQEQKTPFSQHAVRASLLAQTVASPVPISRSFSCWFTTIACTSIYPAV